MKTRHHQLLLGLVLVGCTALLAVAGTNSGYQPTDRPLGLSVIGQTQLAGSDAQALVFEGYKAGFMSTCTSKLPESVAFTGAGLNQLDPQRLYFQFTYAPRVYYLYEGACYNNALGATIATVTAPTNNPSSGNTFTIFPWVHSSVSSVCSSGSGVRSSSEPLLSGDFVQLPTVNSGQQLAFFIMSNMNSNWVPANEFYNGTSNNVDNFQHMIAFFPDNASQFIIIGFEDMLNGGDKDCNDLLFVVDIGPNNAAAIRNPTVPK